MNKPDSAYNKGVKLLKEENFADALSIFNELIQQEPENADYISERGVVYFHMKMKKEALADMDLAVKLEPKKSYRYSSRAYIRGHFKEIDLAIEDYKKAIELDPEDAIAHNNLGLLEEQLGYQQKAQRRYKLADELNQSMNIDGRSDQGLVGTEIKARNIQKELEEEQKNKTLWKELRSLASTEGRASFFRFIKSGFKNT